VRAVYSNGRGHSHHAVSAYVRENEEADTVPSRARASAIAGESSCMAVSRRCHKLFARGSIHEEMRDEEHCYHRLYGT